MLSALENAGYEAYVVGGCVRDMMLGKAASDFDVTTSALPEEVEKVFSDCRVIETGIKHGTVTVLSDGDPVEITTFRVDGDYLDSRHPESVTFTSNVEKDLARRDFTMNSIACDRRGALVDPFGGAKDIKRRVIRCTGEPDKRFFEDALRIMRAVRFSSTLGFEIEEKTADSIRRLSSTLSNISAERKFSELKKLLCGDDVFRVLTEFPEVITAVIPELSAAVGFDQKNRYHCYDVYTHIAKSVEAIEPDPTLRLAMLLHDVGKPYVMTEDPDGYRHFRGHSDVSEKIAAERLAALHADGETLRLVPLLCKIHDRPLVPEKKAVRRLFLKYTFDEIVMLCKVNAADSIAHAPECRHRADTAFEVIKIAEEIKREGECVKLSDLAVNGNDMKELGLTGREIGDALHKVLELVVSEELENEKDRIIEYLKKE